MTPAQERLAQIVSNAEAFGYLDHKYAEVMHAELSALLDSVEAHGDQLQQAATMLNAELTVARAEVDELTKQRDAVREYLGDKLVNRLPGPRVLPSQPESMLRQEVQRIIDMYPDRKIQAIKELRGNLLVSDAWFALGADVTDFNASTLGPNSFGSGNITLSLKTSKDIIDYASKNMLLLPTGAVPL